MARKKTNPIVEDNKILMITSFKSEELVSSLGDESKMKVNSMLAERIIHAKTKKIIETVLSDWYDFMIINFKQIS